eukprot:GHUV01004568.1.p1 GENE.GHUV01004568.1~~GHUV01004568.1.p1  ORF type:complete len:140 (+),score=46.49 GHUV01004568.1:241-660(+)
MASRIVAQLLVAGATTVLRAASQAWHKALQNAHKTGVAQEAVKQTAKVGTSMSTQEARQILNVQQDASLVDVAKRYKHMMEVNQKYGSFYLQSKVYRAWEALDSEYQQQGKKSIEEEAAVQRILHQDTTADTQQQQGKQ